MKRFWIGLLHGVLCLWVGVALGLAVLLACDWLYRADVRLLDIPAQSGLEETVILENYHAAVSYLAPWNDGPLELRGLPWSAQGREFFRRLRVCVLCVYILGLCGGVGLICLHGKRQRLGRKVWNVSGAVSLGLAAALGVLLALDFARLESWACGLLFGDSWQMYEDWDPIVTIFPQSYFVHGAFFIIFVCVAGCLLQFAAGYTPATPHQPPEGRLARLARRSVEEEDAPTPPRRPPAKRQGAARPRPRASGGADAAKQVFRRQQQDLRWREQDLNRR